MKIWQYYILGSDFPMQHNVWVFRFRVTNISIFRRSSGGNFSRAEAPAENGLAFWETFPCCENVQVAIILMNNIYVVCCVTLKFENVTSERGLHKNLCQFIKRLQFHFHSSVLIYQLTGYLKPGSLNFPLPIVPGRDSQTHHNITVAG